LNDEQQSQVGKTFSQIGLYRTFLKQSSILWGVRQKLGTSQSWGLRSSHTL